MFCKVKAAGKIIYWWQMEDRFVLTIKGSGYKANTNDAEVKQKFLRKMDLEALLSLKRMRYRSIFF